MISRLLTLSAGAMFCLSGVQAQSVPDGPQIAVVTAKALSSAKSEPITDLPFMKVTGGKGATAKEADSFKSPDGAFEVGVSSYDRVTLAIRDWPFDEYMHILSGKLEVIDKNGSHIFGPGEAFVMPKGFNGTWRVLEPLKKIAIVYSPK
jgi:uncharacterized cupin superfamily protein